MAITAAQYDMLVKMGYTPKQIESYINNLEYRREYNDRPEVKAKRTQYNKDRYARMKEMSKLLRK
jgi:hypothetical protein